ncbi:MAG: hypothetical protein L0387_03055 [Acidobacteria bacterium]|nr:hypothetical protein [Acidobacteriota bacterium]MCI0723835.1 hypothetical protein [Acidobacteriota bacterium]
MSLLIRSRYILTFLTILAFGFGGVWIGSRDRRVVPSTNSDGISNWELESSAIYVADLSKSRPASGLSKDGRPGTWKVVPFETATVSGNMLFASPSAKTPTPELRLAVPVRGWHAVYVGINYQYIWHRPQLIKLRFDSDPAFTWLAREGEVRLRVSAEKTAMHAKVYTDRDIVEVFWKAVQLSGEDLIIARKAYNPLRIWHAGTDFNETVANLSYLKMIPLSEREISEMKRSVGRRETRRILGINDMGWLRWVRSKEELHEELEPLRGSDVSTMLWGTFRGFYCAYFRTKAGAVPKGGDNEFDKFFSTFGEGMDAFRKMGIDPLEEAVSYAHSIGIKLIASIRLDGPKPPPYDGTPGPFFDQHPEYRLIAPDGSKTLRLSLAYPEVRRQYLNLFREALGYGVDGIALVLTRNFPFVGYETPVVESFRKQYGLDPRRLKAPEDEKFLLHQAGYVTTFLQEIRALLKQEGDRRGERLQLAVTIGGNPPAQPFQQSVHDSRRGALEFGWDVKTWVDQRLIEHLVLHPWHDLAVTGEEVRNFSAWVRGSGVRFYVDFFPEELPAEIVRRRALDYYAAGADGFCLWNTDLRVKRPGEWAVWRVLGHREELEKWDSLTRRFFRIIPLKSLAGYELDASWWHSTG